MRLQQQPGVLAFRGLQDYGALKGQSDAVYDQTDAAIRQNEGSGYNATLNLMNNQQAKVSQWAPFFQAMDNQNVSKVGQDMARPAGLAAQPGWWAQGDAGKLRQQPIGSDQPLMQSTNIATPPIAGLKRYRG